VGIAHWDEVESYRRAKGEMDATWQRLGEAAGTKGVGVNRVRVAPGKLPTPPHSHGASEEVFYVLAGSGLAWQDDNVHEVRPGDCVIHRANELEHTFVAGPDGLEYLVFGTRHPTDFGWLPRSGAVRFGWPWVEGRIDDPWDREAEGPPLAYGEPTERPPNIVNVDEVEHGTWGSATTAPLATTQRSDQAGFHWERLDPGSRGSVPHCHSEEEEVFVILEGDATLELWPAPVAEARGAAEREDIPIRMIGVNPTRQDVAFFREALQSAGTVTALHAAGGGAAGAGGGSSFPVGLVVVVALVVLLLALNEQVLGALTWARRRSTSA